MGNKTDYHPLQPMIGRNMSQQKHVYGSQNVWISSERFIHYNSLWSITISRDTSQQKHVFGSEYIWIIIPLRLTLIHYDVVWCIPIHSNALRLILTDQNWIVTFKNKSWNTLFLVFQGFYDVKTKIKRYIFGFFLWGFRKKRNNKNIFLWLSCFWGLDKKKR